MHRTLFVLAFALVPACSSGSKKPAAPAPIDNQSQLEVPPEPAPVDDGKLAVTGVSPATGDELGGQTVRITGRRFTADGARNVKVYFGSIQGQVLRFEDDETLIVMAPGGKVGAPVDVKLFFEPGGVITLPGAFTFTPSPP